MDLLKRPSIWLAGKSILPGPPSWWTYWRDQVSDWQASQSYLDHLPDGPVEETKYLTGRQVNLTWTTFLMDLLKRPSIWLAGKSILPGPPSWWTCWRDQVSDWQASQSYLDHLPNGPIEETKYLTGRQVNLTWTTFLMDLLKRPSIWLAGKSILPGPPSWWTYWRDQVSGWQASQSYLDHLPDGPIEETKYLAGRQVNLTWTTFLMDLLKRPSIWLAGKSILPGPPS